MIERNINKDIKTSKCEPKHKNVTHFNPKKQNDLHLTAKQCNIKTSKCESKHKNAPVKCEPNKDTYF